MPTKTFSASKDSIVAVRGIDSASFGAGKDYHNYVGDSGDYTIRSLIQFTLDFTNVASINSATLYLKTPRSSDGTVGGVLRDTHGTWNSGSVKISRVTSTWTEGSFGTDEGFNGTNSVEWDNQPSTTTTGAVNFTTRASRPSSPSNDTIVITDIVKAWAPLTVTGGSNATNYGIQIRNNTEGGSDYCEWYSLEGGASGISGAAAPYIVIDYTAAAPTVTIGGSSTPASAGIAKIVNLHDTNEWSASTELAMPQLGWNYASTSGLTQGSWRVKIYSNSVGGTTYYDSGQVTDATHKTDAYFQIPPNASADSWLTSASGYTGWSTITGLVNGTEYWWTTQVWDSAGNTSSESSRYAFKVRWGQVIHSWDSGSTSSSQWDIGYPATAAGTQAAMLYRSTTTSTATTGTWYTSLADVTSGRRYLQTMLRLATDAGVQPSIGDITFSYLSSAVSPDNWEVDANGTFVLDNATYRFGTKSGYLEAVGSSSTIIQPKRNTGEYDVAVIDGNSYIFSAYVRPSTQTLATSRTIKLRVYEGSGNSASLGAEIGTGSDNYTAFTAQDGWYRLTYQFVASAQYVKPVIEFGTGTGAAALDAVHIDGAQVEEGNVVRSWTPGFVTQAITIEGSGITIDKLKGGSLRLRGATGGSRDVIELGDNGFVLGGVTNPTKIYSADEYQLTLDGHLRSINASTTAAAFYASTNTDTVSRFAILADGSHEWGAGGATVRDTNLYRSEANVLKTDDSLWIAGNTLSSVDRGGSADSTTITYNTEYYALTNAETSFTPTFVGQRWLLTLTGYASLNTTTVQYAFVRGAVHNTAVAVSTAARSSTTATINTSTAHGMTTGDTFVLALTSGPTNFAQLNGLYTVASAPTTTSFTYVAPSSGTITSGAAVGSVYKQVASIGFSRAENFGSSGRGGTVSLTKVYTATTAGVPLVFKFTGTTQTTAGLTLSMAYTQINAYPLG
jgi:hypothetical protein